MRLTGTPLLMATAVCLSAALVSHLIAVATSFWLSSANTFGEGMFLNMGLWVACFSDYKHVHEHTPRRYDGCHMLYSDYYVTIREWLIPR
jgi:hypothetical protein